MTRLTGHGRRGRLGLRFLHGGAPSTDCLNTRPLLSCFSAMAKKNEVFVNLGLVIDAGCNRPPGALNLLCFSKRGALALTATATCQAAAIAPHKHFQTNQVPCVRSPVRCKLTQVARSWRSFRGLWFLSFMQDLARRCRCPRWSRRLHGAFLFFSRVPTLFLAGRSFSLLVSHCAARRAARMHALFASPRTDDRRTNDATCGPQQAWLTGSLHEGGIRSARSPLRRAPLLATPIAMPLQCGRPKRPGLLVS